jgi:DinB superfamily
MNTWHNSEINRQLKSLLLGGNAHATLKSATDNVPAELRGIIPGGLPYSIWQVLEHLRLAQADILDFSRNSNYKSMRWPEDYWPKESTPADSAAWDRSLKQIEEDRQAFIGLIEKPGADLFTPFPWGDGQNLLREALLIADHNSYHTGEIIILRRLLGIWKK